MTMMKNEQEWARVVLKNCKVCKSLLVQILTLMCRCSSKFSVLFKRNLEFLSFCKSQKSGASWAYVTFLRIPSKIPRSWLELIKVILSFLKIFSLEKAFTIFFQYSRKSARKSKSKEVVFWKNCALSLEPKLGTFK